jgi:hypothetical protein
MDLHGLVREQLHFSYMLFIALLGPGTTQPLGRYILDAPQME